MKTKRIAILWLGVGAGHRRAAEAIEQVLHGEPFSSEFQDVKVQNLDALDLAKRWFFLYYVQPYWWMLRRAPWLWRWIFERRQSRRHSSTAPAWVFRRGCQQLLEHLRTLDPHLVIATEIGAAEIAALGRREGFFSAPILAVQTDYQTEPPWVQPEIDFYCAGSDEAKSQLIGWGVSAHRVITAGIPVDPAFTLRFEPGEVMRALGLDPRRPVILVMGGGMGPVPLDEIVRSLEICRQPLQVVAVAGHDQQMKTRLEALRSQVALDLHIFGWSDSIPELMSVASLLVTKPGGVTTAEALAAGVPVVLTHPIPGPEERHARYLERLGVAVEAKNPAQVPQIVTRLLAEPRRLEALARRARDVARPDSAYTVAHVAHALLDKGTFIDLLAAPPIRRSGDSAYLM
jgi:processive 1,2-diacylglycerol beta-glucosyltransferase